MQDKLQIIGDAVEYNGEPVARITVGTSTVRDGFEACLLGERAPLSGITIDFLETLRAQAKKHAQANAITLDELNAIIDIALDK